MGSASHSLASSSSASASAHSSQRASMSKEDAKMSPSHPTQDGASPAPFHDEEVLPASPFSSTPDPPEAAVGEEAATSSESSTRKPRDPNAAAARGARARTRHLSKSLRAHLGQTVSHEEALVPMAWQSFLTGAIDALLYAKAGVWSGYQTGNMVQLSQNIAQYILPQASAQRDALRSVERAVAITAFVLGSFFAARIASRIGERKRAWLVLSSVLQSVLLWAAAGLALSRPKDEAPNFRFYPAIFFCTSLSFGMQSLTAQKMASPAWATTVAYTATLTQIAADPYISAVLPSSQTRGRDLRLLSIVMLCFGAGVAECWLNTSLQFSGSMALCAAFKLLLALLWLIPKGSA